jgi:hypothetical protein
MAKMGLLEAGIRGMAQLGFRRVPPTLHVRHQLLHLHQLLHPRRLPRRARLLPMELL